MIAPSQNHQNKFDFRLMLAFFVAASVGLSMAWVSIAKFALFIFVLVAMTWRLARRPRFTKDARSSQIPKNTGRAIAVCLLAFSLSLFWTTAQSGESLGSLGKYGKLLTLLLLPMLLRSRREVIQALTVFAVLQALLAISSWLLFFGLPVPWATSQRAVLEFSVFSTYLDQSIMSAVTAAVCWHLRASAPTRHGQKIAVAIAFICMSNVLFALIGRSGHVVAIVVLSLAIMWELPRRYRFLLVILPAILLTAAYTVSPKVQMRVTQVQTEVQAFSFDKGESVVTGTSSGIRLHFWHRALQSIEQSPWLGSGVGSWSNEYNRLEKQFSPGSVMLGEKSNPHQEYLLWGVQLGVLGIVLFFGFLMCIVRDMVQADAQARRAGLSALAALAVSCLFNSTIFDALIGDFFCVVLGLLLALALHHKHDVPVTNHPALKVA